MSDENAAMNAILRGHAKARAARTAAALGLVPADAPEQAAEEEPRPPDWGAEHGSPRPRRRPPWGRSCARRSPTATGRSSATPST